MGSKKPIQNYFYYQQLQYHKNDMMPLYSYTERYQELTKCQKLKILVKKGDPWGDSEGPKVTFEQQILLFSVIPDKNQQIIILKYAQKHSESNFGSAYF